jgi:hypothetical protein
MTSYTDLSPDSKVWVYLSGRELSNTETESLTNDLLNFTSNWSSHGEPVKGHVKLLENRFIVFFADVQNDTMCGRAIDAILRFIKELEIKYSLSLLDRNKVAFLSGEGKVVVCSLSELEKLAEGGIITSETLFFNNLVETKDAFEKNWKTPFKDSWQKKLVANSPAISAGLIA